MGSCISKCRPKPPPYNECNLVQDKLVISQAPATSPNVPLSINPSHSPLSSPSSSSLSFSSTSASTNSSSSSSTSNSSACSSSVLISKDRSSFSNEFLWSCIKENPHIVPAIPSKATPAKDLLVKRPPPRRSESSPSKQSIPPRRVAPQQLKRGRDSSPTLTRQKSFRRDFERPHSPSSLPSRTFRSPSPSRRLNNDEYRGVPGIKSIREVCSRNSTGLKTSAAKPTSLPARKEILLRPRSPSNNVTRDGVQLRNRETSTLHIRPDVAQNAVAEVLSYQDYSSLPMDDIDNPLISLDCFIFL
ncbi:PREDICTED: putative protein TPRXL [Nelumbo nucifera]|uniref:Uncharacterized protein n=2 Tax=Nelumbo nucifera TaxID=4432 RepID=A0A1U8B2V0_NELNU|nr:PREDICTED: putative protein TPRXL [Nelumbo nucifera]DAD39833.1 TPA_asm: hypothetical protein HUJ06_014156 [Nelumbo nucifera]